MQHLKSLELRSNKASVLISHEDDCNEVEISLNQLLDEDPTRLEMFIKHFKFPIPPIILFVVNHTFFSFKSKNNNLLFTF